MEFPEFLLPYFVAASPGGLVAFAAKPAVYCWFQRSAGAGLRERGVPIGAVIAGIAVVVIVLHLLCSAAGIIFGTLVIPQQGFGWKTHAALYFLYAATLNVGIELACLFPLRRKLGLRRVTTTILVANAVYFLLLGIGYSMMSGPKTSEAPSNSHRGSTQRGR
jgi:hypothetical protein